MTRCVIGLAAVAASAIAQSNPDQVTSLPGWTDPFRSNQYSGYLSVNGGKQIHYHFVESESNPATDNVVLWLNGGPGCSSLIGFWSENGPFTMNGDGTISENPGRWCQKANVLYLEGPIGVGFSYWPGQPLPYYVNDTETAADNAAALVAFMQKFPAFASNPLWLSGESYAGVYVPMLAQAILALPNAGGLNLKGILVGNGAAATGDWYEGGLVQQRMQHAFNHGLFAPSLKAQIDAACDPDWINRSDACQTLLGKMADQMGNLSPYNIEYTCASNIAAISANGATDVSKKAAERAAAIAQHSRALYTGKVDPLAPLTPYGADPCSVQQDAYTAYLNSSDVQVALHVTAGANTLGGWNWYASGSLIYTRVPQDERVTIYPGLLQKISVLIFNGDQDECIPYLQDQSWTANMSYPVKADWRPWMLDGEVAGYVTEYASPVRFAFVTVKRAGHMVPQYQPMRALAMMQRFTGGQEF